MKYLTFRTKYKESLLWFQDRKTFLNLDSKAKIIKKLIDSTILKLEIVLNKRHHKETSKRWATS